MFSAALQQV